MFKVKRTPKAYHLLLTISNCVSKSRNLGESLTLISDKADIFAKKSMKKN